MSISSRLMRCSSRSSGPSKRASLMVTVCRRRPRRAAGGRGLRRGRARRRSGLRQPAPGRALALARAQPPSSHFGRRRIASRTSAIVAARHLARPAVALGHDVAHPRRIGGVALAALADRRQRVAQQARQLLLVGHAGQLAGHALPLRPRPTPVRVELAVVLEHHAAGVQRAAVRVQLGEVGLGPAGIGGAGLLRVGVGRLHLAQDLLRRVGEQDGVAHRLAHAVAVEAAQAREGGERRLGLDEHRRPVLAVDEVEAPRQLARQLDVRHLVLAHRHVRRLVEQDVRRLQHGVAEVAVGDGLLVEVQVADLLLERRDALEPRLAHQHREQQVQLGVLLHLGLDEEDALLRVEPGPEPVEHHVVDVVLQPRGVLVAGREHVPVGDHVVVAPAVVLQPHPVLERADVVAQVHAPGGAHAREDAARLRRRRGGNAVHGRLPARPGAARGHGTAADGWLGRTGSRRTGRAPGRGMPMG